MMKITAEVPKLTVREGQVLHLLADEMTNKEIARILFLSDHTVKNIMVKWQAKNTQGLIRRGFQFGILTVRNIYTL